MRGQSIFSAWTMEHGDAVQHLDRGVTNAVIKPTTTSLRLGTCFNRKWETLADRQGRQWLAAPRTRACTCPGRWCTQQSSLPAPWRHTPHAFAQSPFAQALRGCYQRMCSQLSLAARACAHAHRAHHTHTHRHGEDAVRWEGSYWCFTAYARQKVPNSISDTAPLPSSSMLAMA